VVYTPFIVPEPLLCAKYRKYTVSPLVSPETVHDVLVDNAVIPATADQDE